MIDLPRWKRWTGKEALQKRPHRPRLEALEDRTTPVTNFVVDHLGDVNDGNFGPGQLTLREALEQADVLADSSLITFSPALVAAGDATIDLVNFDSGLDGDEVGPTAFVLHNNITIQGPSGANGITIRRANQAPFRLFHVTASARLTLENLNLTNGQARGFIGGTGYAGGGGSAGMGGAIFNQGTLTLRSSTLFDNRAVGGDGGQSNVEFSYGGGGAGLGQDGENEGVENPGSGGGPNGGDRGNGGYGGGGGGDYSFEGSLNYQGGFGGGGGGQFGGGGAGGFGGGGGSSGSAQPQGDGGGFILLPDAGLGGFGGGRASELAGGGGAGMGGAIFNDFGSVTLEQVTLSGNLALGGTGGENGKALGGAIFNRNGNVTSLNSTLTDSTAAHGGRGIFSIADGGQVTVTLNNTIVGQTDILVTDVEVTEINNGTNITVGLANLIRTSAGFTGHIGSTGDPMLGPLADNGGPTLTHALLTGSPALEAGSNLALAGLTTDQRGTGFDRINNPNVDLGAVESPPVPPLVADVTVTFNEDTAYTFSPANFDAGFTDSFARALDFITIVSLPATGTLRFNSLPVVVGQTITRANIGGLVYSPLRDANGAVPFSWNGSNGESTPRNPALMTMNILPVEDLIPPVLMNQSVLLNEDTSTTFSAASFGLTSGQPVPVLQVKIISLPTNGTLKLAGSPVMVNQVIPIGSISSLSFTPTANANGLFQFGWSAANETGFAPGNFVMFLNVQPTNDPPVNRVPANTTTPKNQPITFTNAFSVSDVDSDTLVVRLQGHRGKVRVNGTSAATVRNNGEFVVFISGTTTDVNRALASITLTPITGTTLPATLTMTTNDRGGSSRNWLFDTDSVRIAIVSNHAPVRATGDLSRFLTYTTKKNTLLQIPPSQGVANLFHDQDGDAVRVFRLRGPRTGTHSFRNDGSFDYRPKLDFLGSVTFTVRAFDGQAFGTDVITITIRVI